MERTGPTPDKRLAPPRPAVRSGETRRDRFCAVKRSYNFEVAGLVSCRRPGFASPETLSDT